MKIAEKILLQLSRKPGSNDYQTKRSLNIDNVLSTLTKVFPHFFDSIADKTILDFGCGEGYHVIALARNGARYVLGIDINQKALKKAKQLAKEFDSDNKVEFVETLEKCFMEKFDIVISKNSMEHFREPMRVLGKMKSALKPNGQIFISFGPPWFAPYGSHMDFFTKVPWINIIFDEKTIMKVRARFRNDVATKYEEIESGLNKLSVSGFEKMIADSGLKFTYRKYYCVRGFNLLRFSPLIRELFINRIVCILSK